VKAALNSPLKLNGSVAVLFGKKGLISAEYGYTNYKGMYYADKQSGSSNSYSTENGDISSMTNANSTIKIGGEYKITDNFAVRAGFAYITPTQNERAEKISYINTARTDMDILVNKGSSYFNAGFGYRDSDWYFDIAYSYHRLNETFYAFNASNVKPADITTNNNNIILTVGLRF
jgi:hypothetical protein